MPEGIAKTAVNPNIVVPDAPVADQPSSELFNTTTFNGIPLDIYRLFTIDVANVTKGQIDKLTVISEWAKEDSADIGDAMTKLGSLETTLGVPRGGENRISRLFNWIRISNQINDLDKRRASLTLRRY